MKALVIVVAVIVALILLMALIGALVSRDHRATSTVTLRQPADTIWRVVRDLGGVPAWFAAMQQSTRLPDRDGHEVWRQKMSGFDVPIIVIESIPQRRLVTQIDPAAGGAFGGTWTYELTPDASGTRVSVTEAGWIKNPLFRFLSRFVFGYYGSLDKYLAALGRRFGETVQPNHS
jgi:uncharacterized protein YndB with AHSA1/START domain